MKVIESTGRRSIKSKNESKFVKKFSFLKFLFDCLCLLLSAFLFFLSHPNIIFGQGVGGLGFVALVPVFFVLNESTFKRSLIYGFIYGVACYWLLCYWLAGFNPYTIFIGLPAFGLILSFVFGSMVLSKRLLPSHPDFAMALVWLVYEYIKTLGFLGFPYGIIGYTQWKNVVLLQSASFGGVWILSALCVFVSAACSSFVKSFFGKTPSTFSSRFVAALKNERFFLSAIVLTSIFMVVYGFVTLGSKSECTKQIKVACIQNNTDSNKYGFEIYKRDVAALMDLTDEALREHPDIDFVVWPETAVVPPILYNYEKKSDENRYKMVLSLMDFMAQRDSCFVLGNQMSVDNGGMYTDDYNAALVFDAKKSNLMPPNPEVYYKIHLVPFTEYFPYGKIFPHLYNLLLMGDTHLWTPGTQFTVFNNRGLSFSTPICFEDTFGDLCRRYVKNGARCFFNLTNDSWSKSVPCQIQHLSMAVFRSVENGVPTARSTASGETCFIDSHGRVSSSCDRFKKTALVGNLCVNENYKPTFYNRFGDWIPFVEIFAVFVLIFRRIAFCFAKKKTKNR